MLHRWKKTNIRISVEFRYVYSTKLSKEQIAEVDNLYVDNYGKKIPLCWHESYTAYTGKFDKNYFPELLYIPKFERYMNFNSSLANVLVSPEGV